MFYEDFAELVIYTSISQAIDSGYFVLTNLDMGNNVFHNVVILGYHPNGDYIYLDPFYGDLRKSSPANYPKNYVITIKNNK